MDLINRWQKRRAIRKLMTRMPVELARRYGRSDFYTRGQIDTTLQTGLFGAAHTHYAFALFLKPESAADYFENEAAVQTLRDDVAEMFPAYAGRKVIPASENQGAQTDPTGVSDYGGESAGGGDG